MDVQGNAAQYFVSVPSTYDPNTAYRVGFGFHGRNRTHTDCKNGDCAGFALVMQERAVLVYMKSLGGTGWEGAGERALNLTFFSQVLGALKANFCVDERRVFVAGTSSGAHFTNLLACLHGDQLQAFSPVAGVLVERNGCRGNPSGILIHGVDDGSFAQGMVARDFFRARNGCTADTTPPIGALHERVVATRESHECAEYRGCRAGQPITWCEHSEGGYDGSTHGWPKFGGQAIWDFVSRF
jgi:poly(3-hydroxybutyrate) depolymerase